MATRKLRSRHRQNYLRTRLDVLEERAVPAVTNFGNNPQHTGISAYASQPVQAIHWQGTVDAYFNSSFGHYGAPLVTNANTVIFASKLGNSPPNVHVVAVNGNDGSSLWDVPTDFVAQNYTWYPPYQPVYAQATGRVYFAGNGGTIYYRSNADSASGTVTHLAFFGTLADYQANQATYDANVSIDTPLTVDSQGNVFFGVRVTGATPTNLTHSIVRIAPDGTSTVRTARAAAGNDTNIDEAARNSAMALSNDESILYLGVRNYNTNQYGRLVGLNSTTLDPIYVSDVLADPRNGNHAVLNAQSTASPMVAPDGKVFYGILANPDNGSRGWMLQFSGTLATQYAPGGFGWDNTPSIVPAWMVPQYTGNSTYLLFTKYNNYNIGDGDGSNKIAILDPNDTQVDTHPSANGQLIMKEVLTKLGPTPDSEYPNTATAVREWCINDAAVDPATNSVLVNSEDGKFYRWYLPTNTLTESMVLTTGVGEPYTPTVIGADGTMYGQEDGLLFAIGKTPGFSITDTTVASPTTTASFTVSLDYPRTTPITVHYATADGTAIAGVNYTATSGDLTFNPGQKTQTINVPVNPGSVSGASASFVINLTSPTGAVLIDSQGQATLLGRPPRVQSVVINNNAIQRSRVTSIAVNFDQIVTLPGSPAAAFQLFRQSDNMPVTLSAVVNNAGPGTVATLSFTGGAVDFGSLADGRYTLTVLGNAVSNVAGQLDGDANGSGGDDYVLVGNTTNKLFRLFGDGNGSGNVDVSDFGLFRAAFGTNNNAYDFDNDGDVDATDFGNFRQRFGVAI